MNRFATILTAAVWGLVSTSASAALVAHFDFEEGAGPTTSSTVGGWTGTFNGDPQWVTTGLAPIRSGTTAAIDFDGVGDYIATDYVGIAGNAARSVAFWTKFDTITNSAIVAWGDSDQDGEKWHVRINDNPGNGPEGAVRTEIQGSYEIGGSALDDGEWHHVASVYGAGGTFGSGQVAHYIDGDLVGLTGDGADGVTVNTTTSASIINDLTPVLLGGRRQSNSFAFFDGLIDDVRIYDHALTAAEVSALASPAPEPSTLILAGVGLLGLACRRRRR